jgi:hypothetical protein
VATQRRHRARCGAPQITLTTGTNTMNQIIYLVGLVVVVLAILSFIGLG